MAFKVFFDGPSYYKNKFDFYSVGSSPKLLEELINYLTLNKFSFKEINIALYIYNNAVLDNLLKEISELGVIVNVITIPIEGYDANKPMPIKDLQTDVVLFIKSKYELARDIFEVHYKNKLPYFNLYFFPHIYLRSDKVKAFSRGNMPYSLHIKSMLFEHKSGQVDLILSSSNFAVRDLVKYENMVLVTDEKSYSTKHEEFFQILKENSILINDFDFKRDYTNFKINPVNYELNPDSDFIAPFLYDSPLLMEDYLISIMEKATKRIIIVGQHVCPVEYSLTEKYYSNKTAKVTSRNSLLPVLVSEAQAGVKIEILSQTFVSNNQDIEGKFRRPVNTKNFIDFFDKISASANVDYYVNENCHSKYIIIDDSVFVSSFNYTPTQFIYLDKVLIEKFVNNSGKRYEGIYSEVGAFLYIPIKEVAEKYFENYHALINNANTYKITN